MQDELNLQQEQRSDAGSNRYLSFTEYDKTIMKREQEGRHSLRIQVEGLKQTVESLNKDVEEKNDEIKATEVSLRSEVIIPTKMTSLTKIQINSDRVSNALSSGGKGSGINEDVGNATNVHPLSDKFKDDNESLDNHEFECNNDGSEKMSPLEENQVVSPPLPSPLVRYKSLRDHNGRFCLVVKIT